MTDLEAIRKRFDAIIPGPWRWYGNTATDQVYLATTDRGRVTIMTPCTRREEYVYDHHAGETYTLAQARERVLGWCGAHDENYTEFGGRSCQCEQLRDFLRGELDPTEGHRDYDYLLSRGVQVHPDLRFPVPRREDRDRKVFGGLLASYAGMVRYEVLGKLDKFFTNYRTRNEYEEQEGKPASTALYREDFMSIAQPEAEFIEHAPEDVAFLLAEVDRLTVMLEERP